MSAYLSPMQQHRARIELMHGNQSTLVDAPLSLHILNSELDRDLDYLKRLPCIEDKVNYKRDTLLPKWLQKVEKYLQDGQIYQNLIFVYCVFWLLDIGDFDRGLELAVIATEQNQATPEGWTSTIPGITCQIVLKWSESTAANGHSIDPYFSNVFELIKSGKWRIYESDRASWYKFAGLNVLRDEKGNVQAPSAIDDLATLEKAKELLAQASALYPKIGVGTKIKEIESRIKALSK